MYIESMKTKNPVCFHIFDENGYCSNCGQPKAGTIPAITISIPEVMRNAAKYETGDILNLGMSAHLTHTFYSKSNSYLPALLN